MSKLTSFIALAGLFFFHGPAPAAETELRHYALGAIFKLSGRAQEEMTVRDIAAATGIKDSALPKP